MRKKSFPVLLFCLLLLYVFVPSPGVFANDSITLKVGVYENSPKIFTDDEGNASGFWPDIIEYIASEEKWEIEYIYGTWDQCLDRLERDEIDIMPDVAYTEERSTHYDFSNETVYTSWSRVYTRKGIDIQSILDLEGKNVAVLKGSVNVEGPDGIKILISSFGVDCTFLEVGSYIEVFELVESGEADAGVSSKDFGSQHEADFNIIKTGIIFQPSLLYFAFPKDSSLTAYLIERIDFNIRELKEDKDSVYYQSLDKWLGVKTVEKTVIPGFIKWLLIGVGGLAFLLAGGSFALNAQVRSRTKALKQEILERKKSEEHIRNLNEVLKALRGINQLITMEKDGQHLIQQSCQLMVQTRGFLCAWILLFDENKKYTSAAIAGDKETQAFHDQLKQSNYPPCIERILAHEDSLAVCDDINSNDADCLPRSVLSKGRGLISRLEYEGRVYGVVSVYVSSDYLIDPEELSLFRELAGDIAFALYNIEKEEQRLKGQEDLRKSEEKLRLMFKSITEGIVVIGLDYSVIEINDALLLMQYAQSKEELIGKSLFEFIAKPAHNEIRSDIARTITEGTSGVMEYTLLRKDGSEYPAEISASVLLDTGDKPNGIIAVIEDITERKKMQQNLIVTDRLASVGELAAGIAHELNNPLTGIIGFSDLLLERQDIPKDIREDLTIINTEALRTAQVARSLLTFARKHPDEKRPTDINKIIQIVLDLRAYDQKVNNIEVKTRLADIPLVMANDFQLQQVFINIIINAEYFMIKSHKGGKLSITTEQQGNMIRACFTDDGPGITPEHLQHIFDPFYTTKEVGKGTGLGLSICYGIIIEHGGNIYIESDEGKGATFIIELPIYDGK